MAISSHVISVLRTSRETDCQRRASSVLGISSQDGSPFLEICWSVSIRARLVRPYWNLAWTTRDGQEIGYDWLGDQSSPCPHVERKRTYQFGGTAYVTHRVTADVSDGGFANVTAVALDGAILEIWICQPTKSLSHQVFRSFLQFIYVVPSLTDCLLRTEYLGR